MEKKLLLSLILIFALPITACSSDIPNDVQEIEVRAHISDVKTYGDTRVINDKDKVQKVRNILNDANWEKKVTDMERLADFRFSFAFVDQEIEAKAVTYELWISPTLDKVEIAKGEREYTQLNKKNSALLFENLTGRKLSQLQVDREESSVPQ
ncbi:hypothetical protein [Bacillus sp. AK031]